MSDYFGDIRLGDSIDIKFTTRQISGAPSTLSGSPVISAYPSNSTTELTAGITLTVDFDSRTGYNNVRVVASGGNGYLTATNYDLCITTGTVNSVSVVGESIGSFSIENRSALMSTTAARTLVVDAAGLADANVVKIGPTGSGTAQTAGDAVALLNEIEGETDGIAAIPTSTPLTAAQIATGVWQDTTAGDFTVASSIGKSVMNGVALGTGLTVNALTNAATNGDLTATMKTSVQTAADAAITANSLVLEIEAETDGIAAIPTGDAYAALVTTTYAEPSAVPAATATLKDKIGWLCSLARNKLTQTATTQLLRNDTDAATIGTSTVSDDGTTFTRGKFT